MTHSARTLIDLVASAARTEAWGLRLVDTREQESFYPWTRVIARAQQVAGGLSEIGIRRGDAVAIVFPTAIEFFDAFFGTLLAGGIPVPIYPPVRLGRLSEYERRTGRMLHSVGAAVLLSQSRLLRVIEAATDIYRPPLGCLQLSGLPDGVCAPPTPDPDDLSLIQFSSGTTMDPKPVALSHRSLVAQARLLNGYWRDGEGVRHRGVSWLPLYHDMGLIGCVLTALERSADLTLIPPELFVARPAIWLRTISKVGGTVSPAPNFAYGLCVDKIRDSELDGVDLSCWKVALNGAEAVSPSVIRSFSRRFARWGFDSTAMTPVYGLSEAALAVTFSDPSKPPKAVGFSRELLMERSIGKSEEGGVELVSVGKPVPGFTVRVLDPDDRVCEEGEVGRVVVRGPSLMDGYFGRPEDSSTALRNGWLETGDLGFWHCGELYLTGRAKDVLILRGRNHSPEEIEEATGSVAAVRTGCVVAVSQLCEGGASEQLWVFVEARKWVRKSRYKELKSACSRAIIGATGIRPDQVVVVQPGAIPRTSSGKLRRQEALRRHLQGCLAPPRGNVRLVVMSRILRSHLRERFAGILPL